MIDGAGVKISELTGLIRQLNTADKEWAISEVKSQLDRLVAPRNCESYLIEDFALGEEKISLNVDYNFIPGVAGAIVDGQPEDPGTQDDIEILSVRAFREDGGGRSADNDIIELLNAGNLEDCRVEILEGRE